MDLTFAELLNIGLLALVGWLVYNQRAQSVELGEKLFNALPPQYQQSVENITRQAVRDVSQAIIAATRRTSTPIDDALAGELIEGVDGIVSGVFGEDDDPPGEPEVTSLENLKP